MVMITPRLPKPVRRKRYYPAALCPYCATLVFLKRRDEYRYTATCECGAFIQLTDNDGFGWTKRAAPTLMDKLEDHGSDQTLEVVV